MLSYTPMNICKKQNNATDGEFRAFDNHRQSRLFPYTNPFFNAIFFSKIWVYSFRENTIFINASDWG